MQSSCAQIYLFPYVAVFKHTTYLSVSVQIQMLRISPYLVQILENTDQKKNPYLELTLFTQWVLTQIHLVDDF